MKCLHCDTRFEANGMACYPGGYEAPGTFLWLGTLFIALTALGIIHEWGRGWIAVLGAAAGLTLFQVPWAWLSCRGVTCPNCRRPARVWFWSQ